MNIFEYEFMRNAFLGAIMISVLTPIIGLFVIKRRLSFIADAIGHVNMSGITFGYYITSFAIFNFISPLFFAIIFSLLGTILIQYFQNNYKTYKEVAITIVYTFAVSISSIFLLLTDSFNTSFYSILFGSINSISNKDLIIALLLTISILTIIKTNYKAFLITSIDAGKSHLYNINKNKINYLFMTMLAITISITIKLVGVLLVSSFMIIPVLASAKISKNLKSTFINATIISLTASITGIIIAYRLNLPSGAAMVLILLSIYLILVISKRNKNV